MKKEPKYIDIHCHINFKAYKDDGEEVIRRALDNYTWLINVGSQDTTSLRAIEIAHKYPEGVYACIGLHPIHLEESFHDEEETGGPAFKSRAEIFDKERYLEMARDPKVVAIGECGLDYYHTSSESIEKQKEVFIKQIEVANEVGKPMMIHIRNNYENLINNAYTDAIEILKKHSKTGGVVHCFEGDLIDAEGFLSIGFYLSFTGLITYKPKKNKRNCDYEGIIGEIPLDKILTDTDSPYLAPVPHRGERNEPVYVNQIVRKIAEIKNLSEEEVAKMLIENAKKLFRI